MIITRKKEPTSTSANPAQIADSPVLVSQVLFISSTMVFDFGGNKGKLFSILLNRVSINTAISEREFNTKIS